MRVQIGVFGLFTRKGVTAYAAQAAQDAISLAQFLREASQVTEGWKTPEKLMEALTIEPIYPNQWLNSLEWVE